ncbi:fused MFS/spermidine synthase [Sphingomonas aracearum]|uniref:Spermidine synthase n=1 Tax=Sphingomonas aracearum TaxID=2283317 RepID=A0A369VU79_9SPHN|nr:fused MFS/spermidine synthase [Sphingomonas aracearum]RDE05205.1 hypothetical protein DVW87_07995 [Sphingomonas aracearum]
MTEPDQTAPRGLPTRLLFVVAILTGSFLLFLVQPMVARMALPRLGGAPAVWNSAMVLYQALLLGGYAYAHGLGRLAPRRQALAHLGVLLAAALWLPIGIGALVPPPGAEPALWVPWLLGLGIGPLFFAVSAQAPLLQRWFSISCPQVDPYALYAASNLGSFAGLVAYPLLVEPGLALRGQSVLWSIGYALLVLLVAACALTLPRRAAVPAEPVLDFHGAPTRRRIAFWLLVSFVTSGLMLATSTFLTTDLVAMPLLWVLPLGLYLLSFTVAFAARRGVADFVTRFAPITLVLFGGGLVSGAGDASWLNAAVALLLLTVACIALHTALFRARPGAERLTGFYLVIAIGGALGGVFAGIAAPLLFDGTYEFPLLILAAGALVPQHFLLHAFRGLWRRRAAVPALAVLLGLLLLLVIRFPAADRPGPVQGLAFVGVVLLGLLAIGSRRAYVPVLAASLLIFGGWRSLEMTMAGGARMRSYFGVYTIRQGPRERQLNHGTTVHGAQLLGSPARERTPTTYYVPDSGIGRALRLAPALFGPSARIGIVGLGTGTLACYARPGQDWRFFEIDPLMERIARSRFTFLSDCAPRASVAIGDARLSLAAEPRERFDLLALDAFSSDAVPMHLMTREAFATYARVLQPRGLLLVHVSNRFLDLAPVVAAAARDGGWQVAMLTYRPPAPRTSWQAASDWIALSRDPATLARLRAGGGRWVSLHPRAGLAAWTDDYATILPLLKF